MKYTYSKCNDLVLSRLSRVNLLYEKKQKYLNTMFITLEDLTFKAAFPITDWSQYAKDFWEKTLHRNWGKNIY